MSQTGNYTFNFKFNFGEVDAYGDVIMPGAFKDFEKQLNTNAALAKQSRFLNAFNVQTVQIIEETKTPVI